MRKVIVFVAMMVLVQWTPAQPVYELPFGSTGNSIDLTIANASLLPIWRVTIEAVDIPPWLRFTEAIKTVPSLKAKGEIPISFTFAVDILAPVGKQEAITFRVSSSSGEVLTKEIRVIVAAPERLELFQNYPNPFNPTTSISFQLPRESRVNLKIFDLLGRDVATPLNEDRPVGYHSFLWDASGFSSGVYIYQLSSVDASGNSYVARKTGVLLK